MAGLLSIDEALALVLARVRPLPSEQVAVGIAAGRVLVDGVRARVDLPPFPSSAMDGYAVRAADTPGRLRVVGRAAAGRPAPGQLGAGEAIAIATGAVVPAGADAIAPIEVVVEIDNNITVAASVEPGAHVRPVAGDVREGDSILGPGTTLGPAQLGAVAAAGVPSGACARRPRAAVLSTGTELRVPGEPLQPGEIYESNATMLAAALAGAGAEVVRLAPVPDDERAHREALEQGLAADVFVSSGGVSVGQHDLVRATGADLGVEEVFWGVAMKPGKPVAFGVRDSTLVFGLPGNPVSALVGFELFVRPAIRALQGAQPGPPYRVGRLGRPLRRNEQRDELVRARTRTDEGDVVLDPVSGQESHMIVRAAAADALVLIPRGSGELAVREPVRYLSLRP